ncbi:MAG TPA: hypothetical protein VGC26_08995 [Afipia sp.]
MASNEFTVHDVTDFPVVRMRRVWPGYASQWKTEMDLLVEKASPFVVIFDDSAPMEIHEDRKVRGLWLKKNKAVLGRVCRAVIAVEADPATRAVMQAQAQALAVGQAFGVAMVIASSVPEAEEKAQALLYGGA